MNHSQIHVRSKKIRTRLKRLTVLRDRFVEATESPVADGELEEVHVAERWVETRQVPEYRNRLFRPFDRIQERSEPETEIRTAGRQFD